MTTEEMTRFTAWIPEQRRQALDRLAVKHNLSVNYLVNVAIQQFLDSSPVVTNFAHRQTGPDMQ